MGKKSNSQLRRQVERVQELRKGNRAQPIDVERPLLDDAAAIEDGLNDHYEELSEHFAFA